jgi:hypothetical protein
MKEMYKEFALENVTYQRGPSVEHWHDFIEVQEEALVK